MDVPAPSNRAGCNGSIFSPSDDPYGVTAMMNFDGYSDLCGSPLIADLLNDPSAQQMFAMWSSLGSSPHAAGMSEDMLLDAYSGGPGDQKIDMAVNLNTSKECSNQKIYTEDQKAAFTEILDVLRAICHAHMLPLALAWVPVSIDGGYVVGKDSGIDSQSGKEILRMHEPACYVNDAEMQGFFHACTRSYLEKGQGIVGRALKSNVPFFSPDIREYIIKDYPLAHHARKFGLHAALAIRLRSTCTGNDDYILEFFLPVNCSGSGEQLMLLNNLSSTMQRICKSLRTVSEAEVDKVDACNVVVYKATSESCLPTGHSESSSHCDKPVTEAALEDLSLVDKQGDVEPEKMSELDGNNGNLDTAMAETENVSNEGEQQQQQVSEEVKGKGGRKERAPRSDVWQHFVKIKVNGVLKSGKCNYCHREIKADPTINGTSALRKHFNTCKQVTQGDSVNTWKFDPELIRNAFTQMVIEDELPFAFAEKSGFRRFMSIACPRFSMPSRRTITRDTVRIYFEEKAKLKKLLKDSCERVCLTTDCWTSQQQNCYMTVTAHFIDNDWKLHKKVISFFMVKDHKGEGIGKNLQRCLLEWGLDKVMTITVDIASSNDGAINYMRKQMNNAKTSIARGKYLHMRCAAHIINLIVSDGLKEVDISVKRVRAAVRFIKNSTSRLAKFKKCAELEKVDSRTFLNLDICTRWNTTYLMLKAAITYEKVFAMYEEEDPYYLLDLCGEKGHGVPEEKDWENAKKMVEFLGHFYDLTLSVSSTLHVTSNNFFHAIGEVNILLRDWMDSEDPLRRLMGRRMKDKYDKYWGNWHESENENENENGKEKGKENMNLMIFIATAIDPRYKLSDYTKLVIEEMFGEEKGKKVCDAVHTCFRELFEEYRKLYAPSDVAPQVNDSQESKKRTGGMMKSVIAKRMRLSSGASGASKSELEKYLAEDNEETNKFDILAWWKANASRFPILACLARDVLASPISTIASELAFNTSGRVLDDFRTSLTPFMMQALVCTQDWLRRSTPINIEENMEELVKLEQELIEEYGGNGKGQSMTSTS